MLGRNEATLELALMTSVALGYNFLSPTAARPPCRQDGEEASSVRQYRGEVVNESFVLCRKPDCILDTLITANICATGLAWVVSF